jgi:hypothetical protein
LKLEHQQEFVIGGYRSDGSKGVDALLVGYYEGRDLRFAGKERAGLVPHVRRELLNKLKPFEGKECLFVNLPDARSSRWGGGFTAEQMSVRGTCNCRDETSHHFVDFCRLARSACPALNHMATRTELWDDRHSRPPNAPR